MTNNGWKIELKNLQELRDNFRKFQGIMTTYEKETIKADLAAKTESVAGMILNGAVTEYEGAIAGYQAAAGKVAAAKAAELRRWNAGQLRDELTNARTLAELAVEAGSNGVTGQTPADGIRAIYTEAKQSGDLYKVRAAAEVLKVITPKLSQPNDRAAVSLMAADIGRDLDALRVTPEMIQADADHAAALANLAAVQNEMPEIMRTIGQIPDPVFQSGALDRAMAKVRFSPDGKSAEILPDNDPAISQVDWGKMTGG